MTLLKAVSLARPGSFINGALFAQAENAIVYRTRNPIVDELAEIPMMQTFGIFKVSAIMSNRTQVGICVRYGDNVESQIIQGDMATFTTTRAKKNLGKVNIRMRTNEFIIFDFDSRGALILKKLTRGRGYGQ